MPKLGKALKKDVKKNKTLASTKLTCSMCTKFKISKDFYQSWNPLHATGKLPYCKDCLKRMCYLDDGSISVERVKHMLKSVDRPFLYDIFKISAEAEMDTIGTYFKNIASLPQYKNLGYGDSSFEPNCEFDLKAQVEWTEKRKDIFTVTDDVIEFFGIGFSEAEYVAMHKKYNFLKNNYPEKTNMHIEALKTYTRYKVKEEFAISSNDVGGASKWAELANKAATNAKINPSQLSASDLQGGLSSFSELIQAIEEAIDIIPILPQFKYRPNDALDFNIWCYVNYIRDLQGMPPCQYEDVYAFYDARKADYIKQYGDPYGIFKDETTEKNRENIKRYISDIEEESDKDAEISEVGEQDG
jgi:hypothetical protein